MTSRTDMSGSIAKRHKKEITEDRLSALPEVIICYILSLLPTKEAVQTSLLSKKWRERWTGITTISIDEESLRLDRTHGHNRRRKAISLMLFMHRLFFQESKLDKISLSLSNSYASNHIGLWIDLAKKRKVQEIELFVRFDTKKIFIFPASLVTYENFNSLTLESCRIRRLDSFNKLKRLSFISAQFHRNVNWSLLFSHLTSVKTLLLKNCRGLTRLSLTCPSIECLTLEGCEGLNFLEIATSSLKSLTLADWIGDSIEIHAPNLRMFKWISCTVSSYSIIGFDSVFECEVNLYSGPSIDSRLKKGTVEDSVNLLNALSQAQSMELNDKSIEVLYPSLTLEDCLPEFEHLKYLKISALLNNTRNYCIMFLLNKCPNLETLVVYCNETWRDIPYTSVWSDYWSPELTLQCLSHNLKRIEIRNFSSYTHEIVFLKYFLKNARVLKELLVDIYDFEDPIRELDVLETIRRLAEQRASPSLEVLALCNPNTIP